jgi:hypothetical protein
MMKIETIVNLPADIARKIGDGSDVLWDHARVIHVVYWIVLIIPYVIFYLWGSIWIEILGEYTSFPNETFYEID